MTLMRCSSATKPNPKIKDTAADRSTADRVAAEGPSEHERSNVAWLRDVGIDDGIILLGGTSLAHFRMRFAQAQLRSDLLPSYWSLAGILLGGGQFASVPLDKLEESSLVPLTNGVQVCDLADYDNTTRFPNIAVLQFTKDSRPIRDLIKFDRFEPGKLRRTVIDLPTLMLAWLGYIWGAGQQGNPLLGGMGMPSATFVETAYGITGVELTPGLAAAASCPEAIWQSAKWWHDFYAAPRGVKNRTHARGVVPWGFYTIRQPAAAAIGPNDWKVGGQIVAVEERHADDAAKTADGKDASQAGRRGTRKSVGGSSKKGGV